MQFEHHYNEIAEPFDWMFTSADLKGHCRTLAQAALLLLDERRQSRKR